MTKKQYAVELFDTEAEAELRGTALGVYQEEYVEQLRAALRSTFIEKVKAYQVGEPDFHKLVEQEAEPSEVRIAPPESGRCPHPVLIDSLEQPGVDIYVCARCDAVLTLYEYRVNRADDEPRRATMKRHSMHINGPVEFIDGVDGDYPDYLKAGWGLTAYGGEIRPRTIPNGFAGIPPVTYWDEMRKYLTASLNAPKVHISAWDPACAWTKGLPSTTEEIRAFVARLRKHVICEVETQNDVDEACHLIEKLCHRAGEQS